MDFDNLSGSFGSKTQTRVYNTVLDEKTPQRTVSLFEKLKSLDAIKIVDIVCSTLIAAALIVVFCNWEAVMNGLFMSLLFPIIKALAKIISVLAGILCVGGVLIARIHRRRRWYY